MHHFSFYKPFLICIGTSFLFAFTIFQPARARPSMAEVSHTRLNVYIEEQMRALHIPGLALAIVRGDQIEYVRGYGVADAAGRPVTPQTPFLIASLSKSFTALGIMQLAEEGKLRLDAPVQEYLPWFQAADSDFSARLTIRHLLYHSSGFSELEGYKRNLDRNNADDALEASVLRLRRSRLSSPPGEKFEYSNTNYDILGLLIQTASGKPYETYIQENIFAPLKMQHSFTTLNAARSSGLASGYTAFFGQTVEYDRFMPYSRTVAPSAGLFSSAADMAHYLFVHLNQGRFQDGAMILSPEGLAELLTPGAKISQEVSYAMGWTIFPFTEVPNNPGDPVPMGLSHGGDWANFKAIMVLIPEQELGVVVLMNKNDPRRDSAYWDIGWNTALLALGLEPAVFPSSPDFLTQYGQAILAIVLLLLIVGFVWAARSLFQRPPQEMLDSQRRKKFFVLLVIFPMLDFALAGYLLLIHFPRSITTLPLALHFEPDVGLMYLAILVLTLGWGFMRTVLAFIKLLDTKKIPTPAS